MQPKTFFKKFNVQDWSKFKKSLIDEGLEIKIVQKEIYEIQSEIILVEGTFIDYSNACDFKFFSFEKGLFQKKDYIIEAKKVAKKRELQKEELYKIMTEKSSFSKYGFYDEAKEEEEKKILKKFEEIKESMKNFQTFKFYDEENDKDEIKKRFINEDTPRFLENYVHKIDFIILSYEKKTKIFSFYNYHFSNWYQFRIETRDLEVFFEGVLGIVKDFLDLEKKYKGKISINKK